MILDAVVLSVVVAWVRGGSLSRLVNLRFRHVGWIITAFGLQALFMTLSLGGVAWATKLGPYVYVTAFALLILALWPDRMQPGMKWVIAGVALNFLVIGANGGHMPVAAATLNLAGLGGDAQSIQDPAFFTHTMMSAGTRVPFLGDVLPLPKPYPRPKAFSIGDLLMAVGMFAWVQRTLVERRKARSFPG